MGIFLIILINLANTLTYSHAAFHGRFQVGYWTWLAIFLNIGMVIAYISMVVEDSRKNKRLKREADDY